MPLLISRVGSALVLAVILSAFAGCGTAMRGVGPFGGQSGVASSEQLALMADEDVVVVDDKVGKIQHLHVQPGRTVRSIVKSEPSFKAIYRDREISVERNYPDGRRSFKANPGEPGFDEVLNRGDRVVLNQQYGGGDLAKITAPFERLFPWLYGH